MLESDADFAVEFNQIFDNIDVPEADENVDPDSYDHNLDMELKLDSGSSDHPQLARVTKRLKDHRENPIGTGNSNPVLDTRMYEIEFADGHKQALSVNTINENMFASIDKKGHRHLLLDSIIGFRKTKETKGKEDSFVLSSNKNKRRREKTKGYQMDLQRRDVSATWSKLKDTKDSFPEEVAEFSMAHGIADEPAFVLLVPFVIKKQSRIVARMESKYWN